MVRLIYLLHTDIMTKTHMLFGYALAVAIYQAFVYLFSSASNLLPQNINTIESRLSKTYSKVIESEHLIEHHHHYAA